MFCFLGATLGSAEGLLQVGIEVSYMMPGIEPGLAVHEAATLPTVPSLVLDLSFEKSSLNTVYLQIAYPVVNLFSLSDGTTINF